ncbi:unnamed protein product [Ectocarpus sp. CCAP 1310/34]|nr:unnamed protein product [Ectocarpus sp. CCAP 1310/34]
MAFSMFTGHKPAPLNAAILLASVKLPLHASAITPAMSRFTGRTPPPDFQWVRLSTLWSSFLKVPNVPTSKGWVMCDVRDGSWKGSMSREMAKLMASKVVCEAWPSSTTRKGNFSLQAACIELFAEVSRVVEEHVGLDEG